MEAFTLRCFASLRDVLGADEVSVEMDEPATVEDLLEELARRFPAMKERIPNIAVAVNRRLVRADARVGARDEIALLPPVSGG